MQNLGPNCTAGSTREFMPILVRHEVGRSGLSGASLPLGSRRVPMAIIRNEMSLLNQP
jgi:hypothetical protein